MPYSDYLDDYYIVHDEYGNIIDEEDEDVLICPHTETECNFCYSCRRGEL